MKKSKFTDEQITFALKQVFEALRQLMAPPAKRPIGFVAPEAGHGQD